MEVQRTFLLCVIFVVGVHSYPGEESSSGSLGPWTVNRDKITLAGFSSGGSFAQQLQFSYSSLFSGVAVFSHTYYRCGPANGIIDDYDRFCTTLFNFTSDKLYNPDLVHTDIANYKRRGIIEDPANLKNKRLYVYTGLRNALFSPTQSLNILRVYEKYITSPENIKTRVQDANLVLPTLNRGVPCTELNDGRFFIGNCGISGVTEALNFLLFPDSSNASEPFTRYNTPRDSLSEFDQREFTCGLQMHQLDDTGYYYVPRRCRFGNNRRCYLHFYFHGCLTGREFAKTKHIEESGLLEYAERKNIIMVFPQVKASTDDTNKIGCWDTFGLSGEFYATQEGPQIRAVKNMLDKILRPSSWRSQCKSSSSSSSLTSAYRPSGSSSYSQGYGNRQNSQNQRQRYFPAMYSPSKPGYGRKQRLTDDYYYK